MRVNHYLICVATAALLSACGGEASDPAPLADSAIAASATSPAPDGKPDPGTGTQEIPLTAIETKVEAVNFLRMAGLGPTEDSVNALTGLSATDWVEAQLAKPPRNYRADLDTRRLGDEVKAPQVSQMIYETMITSEAEARTRMAFALSQIFVINDNDLFHEGRALATYMDILDRNAFGNYRDVLGEVSASPVMGQFLSSLYNYKGDDYTGRQPDENFAREILQLFSIGLVELNRDGTPRLGADGQPIETYDNDDVTGLARVFTGYVLAGTSHRWRDRYPDAWERPMMMHENNHSPREKVFLGTTIPAETPGEASIATAIDTIFAHPNLAPFVSRQLIQRFTASDPRPDYVERVADAFETGLYTADDGTQFGSGTRGDLGATYAAIVLDRSLHDGRADIREGKAREPVLNFVQAARLFRPRALGMVVPRWTRVADTMDVEEGLSQSPLKSPSVFNFYRPGFVAPGTESGEMNLSAPELQIVNAGSAGGYLNYMFDWASRQPDDWDPTLVPDFSDEIALAEEPEALVDRLDFYLTGGTLRPENRAAILQMMADLPIREPRNDDDDRADRDRRSRVTLAVMMVVASPEYMSLN